MPSSGALARRLKLRNQTRSLSANRRGKIIFAAFSFQVFQLGLQLPDLQFANAEIFQTQRLKQPRGYHLPSAVVDSP